MTLSIKDRKSLRSFEDNQMREYEDRTSDVPFVEHCQNCDRLTQPETLDPDSCSECGIEFDSVIYEVEPD